MGNEYYQSRCVCQRRRSGPRYLPLHGFAPHSRTKSERSRTLLQESARCRARNFAARNFAEQPLRHQSAAPTESGSAHAHRLRRYFFDTQHAARNRDAGPSWIAARDRLRARAPWMQYLSGAGRYRRTKSDRRVLPDVATQEARRAKTRDLARTAGWYAGLNALMFSARSSRLVPPHR